MRVQNISNYQIYATNKSTENKYKNRNMHNVSFGANPIGKTLTKSPIYELPVDYVHELSISRFYKPNVFIGSSLYDDSHVEEPANIAKTLKCLKIAKNAGIKTIVDLDNHSNKYREMVEKEGLEYYSFPVRSCTSEEPIKKESKNQIIDFIKKMQDDNIYIGSDSWMNRDEAAYINFWFNPKFDYVHTSTAENADMMNTFAQKMYSCMTKEDKKSIGWTQEYEKKFKEKLDL